MTGSGPAPAVTTRTAKPASASYRTDLDGLRGIAIALVACFHVWFGKVSGGVDVFLTLSGYFFVGSLLRHAMAAGDPTTTFRETLNPWPRLKRLLRRLLPALLTVLIGVAILTLIVFPETRWTNVGREIIASALYFQNYYLAGNSQDYLAASSANSPLQHIWSMSMQGQFFVLTLLSALALAGLLKLLSRKMAVFAEPRTIKLVVGGSVALVAAASFYYAQARLGVDAPFNHWIQARLGVDQPYNYYDTRSRLWEPLVGGLLAVWMPAWRVANWVRSLVGLIALGLIISCGWWIDGVHSYPGPLALVPVGATLLIIWAGAVPASRHGMTGDLPVVNKALGSRWPVQLGSMAYALYLIHWPLLIFYLSWRAKDHANFFEGTAILLVALGLSWAMKRYVEDPLRGGRSTIGDRHWPGIPRLTYAAALTALIAVASLAVGVGAKAWERHVATMVVDTRNLDPRLYPGARALLNGIPVPALDPQPSPLTVERDYPETSTDGFMSDFLDPEVHVGVYGDPNATRTIALAGGSHAEMWISALDIIGKKNGFKVTTYLKMGCPLSSDPNPTRNDGTPYPQCYEWVRKAVAEIERAKPDLVFTNSTRPDPNGPADHMPKGYTDIFDGFLAKGIGVLGMRDTPWPHKRGGAGINTPECLAAGGGARSCGTVRATALAPEDPAIGYADANPDRFHRLDVSDGVCTPDFCPAIVGNIIVYKDWHHLSATYVRSLTSELSRQMAAAVPWTGPVLP